MGISLTLWRFRISVDLFTPWRLRAWSNRDWGTFAGCVRIGPITLMLGGTPYWMTINSRGRV